MLRSQPLVQTDFDWQQLRQLAGEDPDFEYELLAMFLNDAEKSLDQLEQAIATQNIQAIEDAAHALRGASANVGACGLANAARQLEKIARSSPLNGSLHSLLQQLRRHYHGIQMHLAQKQR